MLRLGLSTAAFLGVVLALLVWGVPWIRVRAPEFCARWNVAGGVCAEERLAFLAGVDAWTERIIRPRAERVDAHAALARAMAGLGVVEEAAERGFGEARVHEGLARIDGALTELDTAVRGGTTQEKISDIPENAQRLIAEARAALGELTRVLSQTSRRAEDISRAVDDTQEALDALSTFLPDAPPREPDVAGTADTRE